MYMKHWIFYLLYHKDRVAFWVQEPLASFSGSSQGLVRDVPVDHLEA